MNTVHPRLPPPSVRKTARLSPAQTSHNGASVMTNIAEVSSKFLWEVSMLYEDSWQFIVRTDNTFGFDSSQESSISVTIDIMHVNTPELLFAFTTDNREYISTSIPMGGTGRPNQIYPACNTNYNIFGTGDIASIPIFDRSCDIAGGSCEWWQDMIPVNNAFTVVSPLTFILENHPITNELILYFDSPSFAPGFSQECKFDSHFAPNSGLKIYLAGDQPGETFAIAAFDIAAFAHVTTPTLFPSKIPTHDPTGFPTIQPTIFPSKTPTTRPTNNPSTSPTKLPTNQPTTNTASPTKLPTKHPTKTPTKSPSASPSKTPTNTPSAAPTKNPTKTPSTSPTKAPTTPEPSMSPTTRSPTKRPTPFGYQYGAYNQLCPNGEYNVYDQCRTATDILTDTFGSIACVTPYDCCMCETVQCGFNGYPCHELRVTGANGLFGVGDIRIAGGVSTSGVSIDCQGIEACAQTVMTASNVISVDCDGASACQDAYISITHPKDGFILECAGTSACEGLHIELILPAQTCDSPVGGKSGKIEVKKILCNSELACAGLHISIHNEGCDEVFITDLECIQPNSCNDAVFDFIGDVSITNCLCGPSCNTAQGLDECFMNLPKYLCKDPYACFAQSKRIINPMNGFEFVCSSVESCRNANFIIELNDSPSPIHHLTGFLMGGQYSAQDATFVIENKQGFKMNLGRIDCSGYGACDGTTFITGSNVFVEQINCAPNSCVGCRIKQSVNGPDLPCDPSEILPVLQV